MSPLNVDEAAQVDRATRSHLLHVQLPSSFRKHVSLHPMVVKSPPTVEVGGGKLNEI